MSEKKEVRVFRSQLEGKHVSALDLDGNPAFLAVDVTDTVDCACTLGIQVGERTLYVDLRDDEVSDLIDALEAMRGA